MVQNEIDALVRIRIAGVTRITACTLRVRRPSGDTVDWVLTNISGNSGNYRTVADDLPEFGLHDLQGIYTVPGGEVRRTRVRRIHVEEVL